MQLYKQTYFNRRNWILENLEQLDLSHEEALCVLYIDYFNEFDHTCDIHRIAKKMQLDDSKVDEMFDGLIKKGYLKMEFVDRKVVYSLEGLFIVKKDNKPIDKNEFQSLFNVFEKEFNRTLSAKETQMISEWISNFELQLIIYALREAVTYGKKNFSYIDKVLMNWKEKNYTVEDYKKDH